MSFVVESWHENPEEALLHFLGNDFVSNTGPYLRSIEFKERNTANEKSSNDNQNKHLLHTIRKHTAKKRIKL
jgi:hypothetical protein